MDYRCAPEVVIRRSDRIVQYHMLRQDEQILSRAADLQLIESISGSDARDKTPGMKALFIINNPPYGTPHATTMRCARASASCQGFVRRTYYISAGRSGAGWKSSAKTPNGYYNVELMLKWLLGARAAVLLFGFA